MSDELIINLTIEDDGSISITLGDDPNDIEEDSPILPCPCCGGKAMLNIASEMWIECLDCHIQTASYDDAEQCLEDWNRRVPL